jgi:hypothetical protein
LSVTELFEIGEADTVWDGWLTTTSLLDLVQYSHGLGQLYDFADSRHKLGKVYAIAETHFLDKEGMRCKCGLSDAEHAILKRKIMTFLRMQLGILKHFVC